MDSKLNAMQQIIGCIEKSKDFVLQGGAGSGKTETIKKLLEYIKLDYPKAKVACITHTNLAVDEIKSRIGDQYTISTIHSFLNDLICDYKKNIHQVIIGLFKIELINQAPMTDGEDQSEYRKREHDNFKKKLKQYNRKNYDLNKSSFLEEPGKREYDKNSITYNEDLNSKIKELNIQIGNHIKDKDFQNIVYNETAFDSLKDLSFGHDGLLFVAAKLFKTYPLLRKILCDKYDYIFIDEYQDTNPVIIDLFLQDMDSGNKPVVGLFGDSMQGIYKEGIGSVEEYIKSSKLFLINKPDNYRCSEQVVKFINPLRNDGVEQKVELKKDETLADRQGYVRLYYAIYPIVKPNSHSSAEEKSKYLQHLFALIDKTVEEEENKGVFNYKKLLLTNKSIASKLSFEKLYNVFNNRFKDVKTEIEDHLERIQILNLAQLVLDFNSNNINTVLSELKKTGYILSTVDDLRRIKTDFEYFNDNHLSLKLALDFAVENSIIKQTEASINYLLRRDSYLNEKAGDEAYQHFKGRYELGSNTFTKMKKHDPAITKEVFESAEKEYTKEQFYTTLFSENIKFIEVVNYLNYLNENTEYITMHKTKGGSFDNVLVLMDEFFWSEYDFKMILPHPEDETEKQHRTNKLFYVSCSRARKNLICVKLITSDEEEDLIKTFGQTVILETGSIDIAEDVLNWKALHCIWPEGNS